MDNEKELSLVKTQATKALSVAKDLVINNESDYKQADEVRQKIKTVAKMIKEKKDDILKPINESVKNIRELFKPIENTCEESKEIIDTKMLAFQKAEDERIAKQKASLASKVETGYIKPETASKKFEDLGDTKTNLKEVGVKSGTRTIRKVRIVDKTQLPIMVLVPDMVMINDLMLKQGIAVPGCEIYEEKIIV